MTSPDGRYRFACPPEWPVPPAGWTPPEGWNPPAEWGPAPAGWQFWVAVAVDAPVEAEVSGGHHGWREAKQARKENERARAEAAAAGARRELVQAQMTIIDHVTLKPEPASRLGLVGKPGELAVNSFAGAGLVEMKRAPGHYTAGSAGVSLPVGGGVRLRTGRVRGHYQPGAESETEIDTGTVHLTSQRAVFVGNRQTREWQWSKLVGRQLFANKRLAWMDLAVSSRQKTSGFSFAPGEAAQVDFLVDLAIALYQGDVEGLRQELRSAT